MESNALRMTSVICALVLGLTRAGGAQAQVDLSTLDDKMAGPTTQVLVLGTVHLSTMPKDFDRRSLQPLIDRLVEFHPQIVTVEEMPGEQCEMADRHRAIYGEHGLAPYCRKPDAGKTATELDVPAAIAQAHKTLKTWPAAPTPAQRRHLAALFMAANDDVSALVQWLQLPTAERRAGDGLDAALVAALEKSTRANSESGLIAAVVAARLGLQRVYAADDHTGDNVDVADAAAFGKAIQQAWDAAAAPMRPIRERQNALIKAGDMLGLYRYINSPAVMRANIDSDFAAALRDRSPEHYGQMYVAGWETRNLRMVANIRAAARERPGTRVLSIVGVSHKPWFDDLLGRMQGLRIVDAQEVLK